MTDLKIDPDTGDLVIQNGDFVLVSGTEELAQRIAQRLSIATAEWFLDESFGVPMHERVLVKNPSVEALKAVYKDVLLSVPGVNNVLSLSVTFDSTTRTATIVWSVDTDTSEIISGTTRR